MADRELLEAAAKAAGIEVVGNRHPTDGLNCDFSGHVVVWRPLIDDGDAFRLAVKLGIKIEQDWFAPNGYAPRDGRARAFTTYSIELTGSYNVRPQWFKEDFGDDPAAATRRAIVRAAAALGGFNG